MIVKIKLTKSFILKPKDYNASSAAGNAVSSVIRISMFAFPT